MNIRLFFAGVGVSVAAALFAAVDPGHQNFHNVAVTSAAQNRTDWRVNSFDWTTAESLGEGVDYLPLKLTTAGGWGRLMVCHLIRVDTSKPNVRFTGHPQTALSLQHEGAFSYSWQGLVLKDGTAGWERLYGADVPDGLERDVILIEEVDFSSGRPRVRYFAGLKESGAATLLADASGATAFDGAGQAASVDGVVTAVSCGTIASLRGFSRVKDPKGNGFILQLVCR